MDEALTWLAGWLTECLTRLCAAPLEVTVRRPAADYAEFVVAVGRDDYRRLHGDVAPARRALAELVATLGARHHGVFRLTVAERGEAPAGPRPAVPAA